MTQQELDLSSGPGVTLFGVGGAGGNAVGRFFRRPGMGMKIICANTDVQALRAAPSASQIQLGRRLTGGLGAGAKPEIGRAAAQEALPEIDAALEGSGLCFIAAGLGGGTGTGAAPVIARAARERGILTIGIATRPFAFEGARRARTAAAGLLELQASVDALVVVCNENLFRVAGRETTFREALDLSDSIVCDSARDFAALIAGPALKRVTIADIHAILDSGGRTVIGYGERCAGRGRATLAAESALRNPLLEDVPHGARRLLVTIAGGSDLGLFEVEEAVEYLREHVHASVDLVWGSVVDPALDGRVRVGIAASGLPERSMSAAMARSPAVWAQPKQSQPAIAPVASPVPVEELQAEPALVTACEREIVVAPAPALVAETHGIPPDEAEPLVAPTAILAEPEPGRAPLVLTSSYSLDLDIVADNPVSTRTIRSRARSASLIDQIYFAIQALKRPRASRPPAPARRAPRDIHIAWANSRPA